VARMMFDAIAIRFWYRKIIIMLIRGISRVNISQVPIAQMKRACFNWVRQNHFVGCLSCYCYFR